MSRFQHFNTTTAAVGPASSTPPIVWALGANYVNIYLIVVTPSIAGTSNQVEIYSSADYAPGHRVYGTRAYTGTLIDPMEDIGSGPVQRNEGFVFPYEDIDAGGNLHPKIYNNHTLSQTYVVDVYWEPRLLLAAGTGLALTGTDAIDARTMSVTADTTIQRIDVAKNDGAVVGSRRQIDFKEGSNITLTVADDAGSNRVQVTIAGTGAANKTRLIGVDGGYPTTGSPGAVVNDNKSCIQFPNAADSEVAFSFVVPDDAIVASDMILALQYAMDSAPGASKNLGIKLRYKQNNASLSALTTVDTIALSNDANWHSFVGTNAKIAGGTLSVGDLVELRVYRDTSVANNAPVAVDIASFNLKYTSTQ